MRRSNPSIRSEGRTREHKEDGRSSTILIVPLRIVFISLSCSLERYSQLFASLLLLTGASAAPQWPKRLKHGQNAPCSEAVVALATGIHLNIQGQYAEYNGTVNGFDIESASPIYQTAFYIAKGELLSDIQAGMNLRQFNQEIAPPGNAAIPGLAKYESAQQAEQALVEGLTGMPSDDNSVLNTLKSDIMAGIKLNENNLVKAIQGCKFTLVFPNPNQSGGTGR